MWMEKLNNGKFKYIERYVDPYSEKKKKVSVTLTSDSNQAKNRASRLLKEKIDERLNVVECEDITVKQLYKKWFVMYSHSVKDTTLLRNSWNIKAIKRHIDTDDLIKNIDTKYLQTVIDKLYYEDEYSYSTVKNCRSIINSILNYALDMEFINSNPTTRVKISKKKATVLDKEKIGNKFLEKEEVKKILDVMRYEFKSKRYADLVEFIVFTGVRYGEALALSNSNINDGILSIEGTLDYGTAKTSEKKITPPKNDSSYRKFPLSKRAIEIVEEVTLENSLYTDEKLLFISRYSNPVAITNFNNSIKRAAKKASINKEMTSHILRHTHISLLAEQGVPLKVIMDRVGHSKPETTLKIYTHVTKRMNKLVVESLDDLTF